VAAGFERPLWEICVDDALYAVDLSISGFKPPRWTVNPQDPRVLGFIPYRQHDDQDGMPGGLVIITGVNSAVFFADLALAFLRRFDRTQSRAQPQTQQRSG
jgi:hypothetical protein